MAKWNWHWGTSIVALLCLGQVNATFYPNKPFIDPACQRSGDCSWTFTMPHVDLKQNCTVRDYVDTGVYDGICFNPFPIQSADERASPVKRDDITMESVSKYFAANVTGNLNTAGFYTCLRIRYQIDPYVASKLKGVQFTLRGKSWTDHGLYYCQNHLHDSSGTNFYAVREYVDQTYRRRTFIYECFCGIRPGGSYEFIIRTLPVDYHNSDQHDTALLLNYPNDLTEIDGVRPTASCQNNNDERCKVNEQALWSPRCQQSEQIQSGNYSTVQVSFDLAPPELGFDRYKVLLYEYNMQTKKMNYVTGETYHLNSNKEEFTIHDGSCNKNINQTLTTMLSFSITGTYVSAVQAFPTHESSRCRMADGNELPGGCKLFKSLPFHIIANPCDSAPCGNNGHCQPERADYTCSCNKGYMLVNRTCVENPCYGNPCNSSAGSCNIYFVKRNLYSYTCTCHTGYMEHNYSDGSMTCVENLCYNEPCQGNGVCHLQESSTDAVYTYMCECSEPEYLPVGFNAKTCLANPCIVNVLTPDLSPCGKSGICNATYSANHTTLDYSCACGDGLQEGINAEKQKTCIAKTFPVLAAALGSVVALLLLIFLPIIFMMKSDNKKVERFRSKFCNMVKANGGGELTGQHPNPGTVKNIPRVLILYLKDHKNHIDVIRKFATFLQTVFKCTIRLDIWYSTHIGDKKAWLYSEIKNADKVIMIFSEGTLDNWKTAMDQKPATESPTFEEFDDMFWPGYKFALDEFEDPNLLSSKYVAAYFEYSEEEHVLPEVGSLAKYRIPQDLDALYFSLHNIQQCSPTSIKHVRDLFPSYYDLKTIESQALKKAIEKMKETIREYPNWYKNTGLFSHVENGGHRGVVCPSKFFNQNSDLDNISFTDVFDEIQQKGLESGYVTTMSNNYSHATCMPGSLDINYHTVNYQTVGPCHISPDTDDNSLSSRHGLRFQESIAQEQQPLLLKTLEPQDVHIKISPVDRIDSGFSYMSDYRIAGNPAGDSTVVGHDDSTLV